MKRLLLYIAVCSCQCFTAIAQTPVPMSSQPALTYVEHFDSIITWTNGFASGVGANRFAPVAIGGSNAIPDPTRITTSSSAWTAMSIGGLQKDTVNGRLMMLVTGTTNNSNSVAFDFFMDFTGINAGTLSFNWETVFNGAATSNRTGTLKAYASVNGTTFTELTAASVTITNFVAANGVVNNVALPAFFNNNPNARLRFYYYNSAGGSSGSRPIIALDNVEVTASGTPCVIPAASATGLTFSNVTPTSLQGNFTAANPSPDEYLVIATALGSLSADPADGMVYQLGDIVGDGEVIYRGSSTTFTANNLSPQTNYTFYVFSINIYCNGIIRYKVINPLVGSQTTPAGPPCTPPAAPPSALVFGTTTTNSIMGSFTGVQDASEYLVVVSANNTLGAVPVNGTIYNTGDILGSGTVIYRGAATNFIASGLNHSTTYYFFVFALNNYACSSGPVYLTTALTGQYPTAPIYNCTTPLGDAGNLTFTTSENSIYGSFHPFPAQTDGYMVVMSTSNSLSALPQNNTVYSVGNNIGSGTIISMGGNYSFAATNLPANTTYYFFIFSYNDICLGGPIYRTSCLTGSAATTSNPANHFYFGNLHAHSSYSDGNKDNPSFTPANDYAYAKNALCLDFLGISEHNHYTQNDNPGMQLPYYQQGLLQAANFTAANPGFLALYGMEWGTTSSGGGHVLVYGIDSLIGWEKLNGNPNYDLFVPKNDFLSDTGLFRKVIGFSSSKAFATLAHPAFSDFAGLAQQSYSGRADSAIVGIAVESGPAFSTNTTYSDPATNMSFLSYWQSMLAKGYRVAPMIDHDNHNTTFGRTAYTRTAVIAPSLSQSDFMQAMNDMRFYATQDCDTRAEILVYNQKMGTDIVHSFPPALTIYAEDPTNTTAVPSIKLMSGRPGSGALATVLKTINGNVLNYTDFSLPDSAAAYYYADITIAGKRTITAPVWYQRIDTGIIIINGLPDVNTSSRNILIKTNPVASDLKLDIISGETEDVWIDIYDLSGRRVLTRKFKAAPGIRPANIAVSSLHPCLYLVKARFKNGAVTRRFVKY